MNRVRLYSNGTAIISREYRFNGVEPLRIAIPVRKTDLDDVVSSLSVFGDVAVTEPPTYAPTNAEQPTLEINPATAFRDLAMKLPGAGVVIEAGTTYEGKLVGIHPHKRYVDQAILDDYRVVVLTAKGVQQVDESSIMAIRFTDSLVRGEIDRALAAKLSQIKPDSSKVELTIKPQPEATSTTITYATPVAAWKIRYQLRLDSEGTELDGQAVVDNDTDDDWAEAMITVITGEPITFATDLAEIRRPARSRVNIVADRTTGAVTAESELPGAAAGIAESFHIGGYVGGYGGGGGGQARVMRAAGAGAASAPPATKQKRAEQAEAETRESGDFSIFTSPAPVTIGAGRSAIIPLFRTDVGDARAVLLYKERDDPQRPFRAVRFRNQAAHALGRGVCEVFTAGDFQGKCVLEPTKPGAEVLLVHAKETGVRVHKQANRLETRRLAIRITAGSVANEVLHRQKTSYRIVNSHPEAFTLEVEHCRTLADSTLKVAVSSGTHEVADIPSGQRIRVTLPAGASLEVKVVEEQVEAKRFGLSASWLASNVIELHAPSAQDPGVQECIDLQGKIDSLEAAIRQQGETAGAIADEQERLIKLIPNGHGEQANAWRTDLASTEQELREVKRSVLPKLKAQMKEAQDALHQALARLQYRWAEDSAGSGS